MNKPQVVMTFLFIFVLGFLTGHFVKTDGVFYIILGVIGFGILIIGVVSDTFNFKKYKIKK